MTFENIVAKGEIAHDEQFLLWPQCFQFYLTIKSVADLLYVERVKFPFLFFRTHIRGQNAPIDPLTKRELEDKRRKYLEHQVVVYV